MKTETEKKISEFIEAANRVRLSTEEAASRLYAYFDRIMIEKSGTGRSITSMRPICVKCKRNMVKEISGVLVAELYQENKDIYRLWYADFFRCPICRAEIIYDYAEKPFWNDYEYNRFKQRDNAIEQAKSENEYFEVKEAS